MLNPKENENLILYDYSKYTDIKQKNNVKNISLIEFNYNFLIVISGNFQNYIPKRSFIIVINILYYKGKKIFYNEYSINEVFGIELYS